jgi:ATP-dependent protease Clp ATPase subunit
MNKKSQRCSFCNQLGSEKRPLFSGPGTNTHICASCLSFAEELIEQNTPTTQQGKCSFCGREHHQVKVLLFGVEANICNECIDFASQSRDGNNADKAIASSIWGKVIARLRAVLPGRSGEFFLPLTQSKR